MAAEDEGMTITRIRRHLAPAVAVAALALAAPAAAHAAGPHPVGPPPQTARPPIGRTLVTTAVLVPNRHDLDSPAVGTT